MRKIIYITILGLILSCNSNKKLEGTWIGAYSYSQDMETSLNLPIRVVVSFEKNKYLSRSFIYDYRSEKNIEKGTFQYIGSKIVYDSKNEKNDIIQFINNDSLIIKGVQGTNNSVYKKLSDSLKNRSLDITLVRKIFRIESENYIDTLNFINDSLLIASSNRSRNPETKWERVKQKDFDILFIEMNLPMIINKKVNDTIFMTGLHKKTYDLKLVELKRMPTTVITNSSELN